MSEPKTFSNCLFQAHKLTPEAFRVENDGRKANQKAAARRQLFIELASFADADGTNAFPAGETIAARLGWSRRKVFTYLPDLETLGYMQNLGRVKQRGNMRRVLIPPTPPSAGLAFETTLESTPEPDSQSAGFEDKPDSQSAELKSQSAGFASQSAGLNSRSAAMVAHNLPSLDLPNKPAIPTMPNQKRTVGRMGEYWAGNRGTILNGYCTPELWTQLNGQDEETILRVWMKWLAVRKLNNLNAPVLKFVEE